MGGKAAGMGEPQMGTSPHGQRLVSPKGIGVAHAGRLPRLPDKRQEAVRGRSGDKRRVTFPARFNSPKPTFLPAAPRPRRPLRLPPQYLSSAATAPARRSLGNLPAMRLRSRRQTPAAVLRWPPMIAAARAVAPATNHFRRAPCL